MTLELDDEETRALLNVLMEAIEADPYPLSPRIQLLRRILAKFDRWHPRRHHRHTAPHRRNGTRDERHGRDGAG